MPSPTPSRSPPAWRDEDPPARHADRHPRLAGVLHRAVHRDVRGAHRDGRLPPALHRGAGVHSPRLLPVSCLVADPVLPGLARRPVVAVPVYAAFSSSLLLLISSSPRFVSLFFFSFFFLFSFFLFIIFF